MSNALVRADLTGHKSYDPVLSIEEASQYTKRHPQTLRKAVRERQLGCLRQSNRGFILFKLSQLNAWLKKHEQKPSRVAD